MSDDIDIERAAWGEWAADGDLRDDFGTFERYLAFARAVDAGAVIVDVAA